MIQTNPEDDNPDWLASELFPQIPGLPRVELTASVELQLRSRDKQLADLRRWLANRDAADSRCGSCGRE